MKDRFLTCRNTTRQSFTYGSNNSTTSHPRLTKPNSHHVGIETAAPPVACAGDGAVDELAPAAAPEPDVAVVVVAPEPPAALELLVGPAGSQPPQTEWPAEIEGSPSDHRRTLSGDTLQLSEIGQASPREIERPLSHDSRSELETIRSQEGQRSPRFGRPSQPELEAYQPHEVHEMSAHARSHRSVRNS